VNRWIESLRAAGEVSRLLGGRALSSVRSNWGLAIASVGAAFAIWMLIQDVENPRAEATVPLGDGPLITVVPVNVANDHLVVQSPTVRVRVEAREDDLPTLRASDFRATVDMLGAPVGEPTTRKVRVESRRDGVRVLAVEPSEVEVTLVAAVHREVQVRYRLTGDLPEGYRIEGTPVLEPAFVEVIGLQALVDAVATVDLDINLSGVRADHTVEGELVARTASGNPVDVRVSQPRGRATFTILPIFVTRQVGLVPQVTGSPAAGYRVTSVVTDPLVVNISGTAATIQTITQGVPLEPVDVTGARATVTQTRRLQLPANVTADRTSVGVRVTVEPIECAGSGPPAAPCGSVAITVGPTFESVPPGLVVSGGPYSAIVYVSGPLERLATLRPSDIRATVSLSGATAGTASYAVAATVPSGLRVDSVERINVTLAVQTVPQ
jgi:YbbR domain-containing protein